MNKIKRVLAAAGTSSVLAVSMAGVAGATPSYQENEDNSTNNSYNKTIDKSVTVSGNCSNYINNVEQGNENSSEQVQIPVNVNGNVDTEKTANATSTNSSSQSNSTTQSNSLNISQDCSTQTTVASAGKGAAVAQVDVPKGAVHAGGGAGVTSDTSFASLLGLTGSVATVGAGVAMRKKGLLGL